MLKMAMLIGYGCYLALSSAANQSVSTKDSGEKIKRPLVNDRCLTHPPITEPTRIDYKEVPSSTVLGTKAITRWPRSKGIFDAKSRIGADANRVQAS